MRAKGYTKETISQIGVQDRGFPAFGVGDTIAVSQRIKEAGKERIQVFQGDVIATHNNGVSSTFIMRKIGAHGVAVERIFPYQTPMIKSIKIVRKGDVRRAKLYYIRERVGKKARFKEKVMTRAQIEKANEKKPQIVSPEKLTSTQPENKE